MLQQFSYTAPHGQDELFALLHEHASEAKILAGGTDLLVNIRNSVIKPQILIDIKRVPEFMGISFDAQRGLEIGASATINEVLQHPMVRDHFPLLQVCAHDLASYQIRNRATVVGNIVNASPCSDMAPALLCLDALVQIASTDGLREVPIGQFFLGVKKTILKPDEVLTRILILPCSMDIRGAYYKLKRINGHDLGIIGVAVARSAEYLRIAVSSAAPTPVATGRLPIDISEKEAIAEVARIVSPISDVRCTKEYRSFMIGVYIRRLLTEVRA
jgi:carbon-monoxide dehydrogenase medium subunit